MCRPCVVNKAGDRYEQLSDEIVIALATNSPNNGELNVPEIGASNCDVVSNHDSVNSVDSMPVEIQIGQPSGNGNDEVREEGTEHGVRERQMQDNSNFNNNREEDIRHGVREKQMQGSERRDLEAEGYYGTGTGPGKKLFFRVSGTDASSNAADAETNASVDEKGSHDATYHMYDATNDV
ncbi:hypothetical protein Pmani_017008 [Petrolisthes manimaculis]|uniref:Uncharacterized protein n=1 Tax=Petrolisthes manimaculis TaxID=1843537 RepID=A0AAE1PQH2_9EUCA|nr:hypothetical protein Pmani_017008 [Petrolisthes manimaculis]